METPHTRTAPVSGPDALRLTVDSPEAMRRLGLRLAGVLRPGDLVLLSGELGAGKTTLTRGLGEGLGVRGAVTSPTFVIARVHPSLTGGPALVHVDAYRLGGGLDEMEDLDLDVSLSDSVVVVEWGDGKVEELSADRLHVRIDRATGDELPAGVADADVDDVRLVTVGGVGGRWPAARWTGCGRARTGTGTKGRTGGRAERRPVRSSGQVGAGVRAGLPHAGVFRRAVGKMLRGGYRPCSHGRGVQVRSALPAPYAFPLIAGGTLMTTSASDTPAVQAVPEVPSHGALAGIPDDAAAEAGQEKKGAVSMSALLQSCAAASAVSTPPELPTPRAA